MIYLQCSHEKYMGDIAETARVFDEQGRVEQVSEIPPLAQGELSARVELGHDEEDMARAQACVDWDEQDERRTETAVVCLPLPKDGLECKKIEKRAMKLALYRALQKARPTPMPWGALTGIRPTKLLRELIAKEGVRGAKHTFSAEFGVSKEKLHLTMEVLRVQRGTLGVLDDVFDAYIGIPFCRTRCQYCAFTSYKADGADVTGYLEALRREMDGVARLVRESGLRLRCLYVGGGTPTAISPAQLQDVLHDARALGEAREITVEAGRPDTLTEEYLRMLADSGVTRISVNPQTMNEDTLRRIGRAHTPQVVEDAVALARRIGFDCINMDIIVGLPGETEAMVNHTLERIAMLAPENLTVHTLAIKRASALAGENMRESLPDAQTAQRMLELCHQRAADMGMQPYYLYRQKYMAGHLENVGYAKPDKLCRYNIDIMEETTSILAMGAGAITKWVTDGARRIERAPNPKDLATYMAKVDALVEAKRRLAKGFM